MENVAQNTLPRREDKYHSNGTTLHICTRGCIVNCICAFAFVLILFCFFFRFRFRFLTLVPSIEQFCRWLVSLHSVLYHVVLTVPASIPLVRLATRRSPNLPFRESAKLLEHPLFHF